MFHGCSRLGDNSQRSNAKIQRHFRFSLVTFAAVFGVVVGALRDDTTAKVKETKARSN